APVHDVDVDPVGAGPFDGLHLEGEAPEVGREDGGSNAEHARIVIWQPRTELQIRSRAERHLQKGKAPRIARQRCGLRWVRGVAGCTDPRSILSGLYVAF